RGRDGGVGDRRRVVGPRIRYRITTNYRDLALPFPVSVARSLKRRTRLGLLKRFTSSDPQPRHTTHAQPTRDTPSVPDRPHCASIQLLTTHSLPGLRGTHIATLGFGQVPRRGLDNMARNTSGATPDPRRN
ncbi:hypothetical protein BaRGS_00018047, partial [Batillaria attramentaria]